jgi:hypothetical protein
MTTGWEITDLKSTDSKVSARGILVGPRNAIPFILEFKKLSKQQIGFTVSLLSEEQEYKTILTYESDPEEIIYGTGEQFTHLNLKGLRYDEYLILVSRLW